MLETMVDVARFAQVGLEFWLLALALIVGWRLLVERRAFQGLLGTRLNGGLEPDRLQLLVAAVGGAVTYITASAGAIREGAAVMPDAPNELLIIMATSQAIYLAGKVGRLRS